MLAPAPLMTPPLNRWSRKDFLKTSLAGSAAALFSPGRLGAALAAPGSANGDIRIAVIGLNKQGALHMRAFLEMPGVRLAALCDVDSAVLDLRVEECAKEQVRVTPYRDYRRLLDDPAIDAVIIATPNHQHSLQAIWALQAGKDVYVEKPISHNLWEGRQLLKAEKAHPRNIVFAGTQNRSSLDVARAVEVVRSGELGGLQWVRGLCYKFRDRIGRAGGPQPIPATVDYDLWTGPADLVPPHRNTPVNGVIHYDWHWFWNYGGGDFANQGIHQMDVARWFLGESGLPPTVMAFGGRYGYEDDAETPNTLISVMGYAKAPLIFEVRGLPMKVGMKAMGRYRAAQIGVIAQCENGYVHASENGTATIYDNTHKRVQTLTEGGIEQHRANFIAAVRSRRVGTGVLKEAHVSSGLCHLGNISYLTGAQTSSSAVSEAVRSDALTQEALGRMQEHLKDNDLDFNQTGAVLGPLLQVDSTTEMFTGPDATIVAAANNCPLRKRTGRGAFAIPNFA